LVFRLLRANSRQMSSAIHGFQRQAVGTGTRLLFKPPSNFSCQAGIKNFAALSYIRLQLNLGQSSSYIWGGGGEEYFYILATLSLKQGCNISGRLDPAEWHLIFAPCVLYGLSSRLKKAEHMYFTFMWPCIVHRNKFLCNKTN
jgi:hypothetical protein